MCAPIKSNQILQKPVNILIVAPSPPNSGEWFSRNHIQGVPSRDAQAVVKAQHEDYHGLTSSKPQEETTDAWKDHRATWWMRERVKVKGWCVW